MTPQILNMEQGTPEWHAARLGIPTASCFADVISKGRGGGESARRRTYMLKILAERITGELPDNWTNEHTQRGHEDEPKARGAYEFVTGNKVQEVGFIIDDELKAGYSPDGLVGDDGTIEIKSKLPHLHLDCLLKNKVPAEHAAQEQGGMLVSGRQWCDHVGYSRGRNLPLFIKRVERDEKLIAKIRDAIVAFNADLLRLEGAIKEMG
ncbi:YqaJ viral recombinase family protein [Candidatus Pacearchaeota archaeon]|nr:YqaJ viral recombinase family protein [Candidatus Pacearchaeota archaeon]